MAILADPLLIASASNASNRASIALFRWQVLWADLQIDDIHRSGVVVVPVPSQDNDPPAMLTPDEVAAQMDLFTMADARTLVKAAPFTMEQLDQMLAEYEHIGLPGVGLGVGYARASHIVAFVLALSLWWFWLNQREAMRSFEFPSPGTIFSVFSRTRASRIAFRVLAMVPVFAAVVLAGSFVRATTHVSWVDRCIQIGLCLMSAVAAMRISEERLAESSSGLAVQPADIDMQVR